MVAKYRPKNTRRFPDESRRSIKERNKLVEDNYKLVWFMFNKLRGIPDVRRLGEDDAIGAGRLGLMYAAELWDESRGQFSTYACTSIKWAILSEARRVNNIHVPQYGYRLKFHEDPTRPEAEKQVIRRARRIRSLPDYGDQLMRSRERQPYEEAIIREEADMVGTLIARLPDREAKVVGQRMAGDNFNDIARHIGISKQGARNVLDRGLKRMRRVLQCRN